MDDFFQVLLLAAMPAAGNMVGGLMAEVLTFSRRALSLALHLAAGIVLAVVGLELIGEALQADPAWAPILALVAGGGFAVLLARFAAAGQVGLILLGWGLAQYPYVIIPDVTFAATATSEDTLQLLLWTLAAGALLLFPSFGYLFFVFKRREKPEIRRDSPPT